MIQAGYYPLRTLEGTPNGYVCLTYIGNQLEVRIRIDKTQGGNMGYKGYFTQPLATVPQTPCVLSITTTEKASCVGIGTIAIQDLPMTKDGIDFTLFSQNKPCMAAQIIVPEPKTESVAESQSTQVFESESVSEPEAELDPGIEAIPEPAYDPNAVSHPEPELITEPEVETVLPPYHLQEFDPFNTTNPAYQWWICTNTDDFYQLMEDAGLVPDPPLYTALSSALGRFGHFLFGQYCEPTPEDCRTLLIFGVPVSGNTPVPSQNNARWIPAHNKFAGNSNYAGYWLYYFDAETKQNVRAKLRE